MGICRKECYLCTPCVLSFPHFGSLFSDYHFYLQISNFDLARFPYFSKLPVIPEDGITDNGGKFSTGSIDQVYVVVDGRLITGQNVQSTSLAVQNLVWLCKYENGIVR